MSDKIARLRELKNQLQELTPSEEKIWLQHYKVGAHQKANDIPKGLILWEVLEKKLIEFYDIPAIEYFKREYSRPEFIVSAYKWARTFRAMGVEEDEVVPIYGPFFPDICAMVCGLNMIGATSYFLKLSISKEALIEETADSKIAVVYDGMWANVRDVFSDDRFRKIIVASASESMLSPKKEIVSAINYIKAKKDKSSIPKSDKYIWLDEAKDIAGYHTGTVTVPFKENRPAFITSSSGTTIGGPVKGTIATNESAIAQLLQGYHADVNYRPGARCLNNLPPTASTSLNCLFFLPLYHGMTVINEPRLSESLFYEQIINYKPQVVITTGSFWEAFFRRLEKEIKRGHKPNLDFLEMPIIGGEGVTPEDLLWMNDLLSECNCKVPLFSGYGLSEVFSVSTVDKLGIKKTVENKRPVVSVGIPYPGVTAGVFDKEGNELGYNQLGELRIKSKSNMLGYYRKPELTKETIKDGWLNTGDIFDIDEDGHFYLWGRKTDHIKTIDGETVYLFDVVNDIRKDSAIKYAIVNPMPLEDGTNGLVAHVVFKDDFTGDKKDVYRRLNERMSLSLPESVKILGYKEHLVTFKASPTTAKKDRNGLMLELDGYVKYLDHNLVDVSFKETENNQGYQVVYGNQEKSLSLSKQI